MLCLFCVIISNQGIERVTKTFDAKCSCSGRSYEYLCPSFAFAPSKDVGLYSLYCDGFLSKIYMYEKEIFLHEEITRF